MNGWLSEYDMVLGIREKVVSDLRKSAYLSAFLSLVFLLLPACSGQNQQEHSQHGAAATAATTTPLLVIQDMSIPLQVELEPTNAQILKENQLRIIVPAEHVDKLKLAKVSVTLTMPSMDHGAVNFEAAASKDGEFTAKIIPTMVGGWLATITFEVDGQTATATYPFEAVP
ncbi:FixH family protein [Brevibacillus reuszeri]|uniref:FixH family protein n=1 Tax=Brevibacillus reuszeri TaxID=54915 RepID=UPI00289E1779|nr:FixH family protein [Brevibacillus reuszeri]